MSVKCELTFTSVILLCFVWLDGVILSKKPANNVVINLPNHRAWEPLHVATVDLCAVQQLSDYELRWDWEGFQNAQNTLIWQAKRNNLLVDPQIFLQINEDHTFNFPYFQKSLGIDEQFSYNMIFKNVFFPVNFAIEITHKVMWIGGELPKIHYFDRLLKKFYSVIPKYFYR